MARFRRARRMSAPRRYFRSARRRVARSTRGVRKTVRRLGSGIPGWAKPSKFTAGVGIASGTATLLFKPIPNGSGGNDSWIGRLIGGYNNYKQSQNPADLLSRDAEGNDVTTILAAQIDQNAPGAIVKVAGFGLVAGLLKHFGL